MTNAPESATRIESDTLGEMAVPADRYWGAQTQRALGNFAIGTERIPMSLIVALAYVKYAAAEANRSLDVLDADLARVIVSAARDVTEGRLGREEFPLSVWQSGSGTQTNMNVNEVLAARANEILTGRITTAGPVDPNDHVNRSQSSNDVIPTALHVAALTAGREMLLPALDCLARTLAEKGAAHTGTVKVGRTHLQDAVPMTFGQEAGAWASQVESARDRVTHALDGLRYLPLGGTAVGTGLNAPPGFGEGAVRLLATTTGHDLEVMPNRFAGIAAHDAVIAMSSTLRDAAVTLAKIADDIRWLASGPRTGLGELRLPANEPGSSMMPGKVNPSQCESLLMVCAQVAGNDAAAGVASLRGTLQLHLAKPLLAHTVLGSITLLADAVGSFTDHLVVGMEPDAARMRELAGLSLMAATALTPELGYAAVAHVVQHAHEHGLPLAEALAALGYTDIDVETALHPDRLSGG
ncbi:MAG: class II fumarate hydratase [Acidimicrobiia bacterium]|nr:class II fumarate hydratase [Acidimicrobiia bacterium]